MEHTIKLSDDQELGLQWASRKDGIAPEEILLQWVDAAATEAARDLGGRLGALKGVPVSLHEDLRRRLLGEPDPEVEALKAKVAALEAKLAAASSKPTDTAAASTAATQ